MSQEDCDRHGTDATNGCAECERELRERCLALVPLLQEGRFAALAQTLFDRMPDEESALEVHRELKEVVDVAYAAGITAEKGLARDPHPRGRIAGDDDGALHVVIHARRNTVVLEFGKRVSWLGLSADDARAWARKLVELADGIES